MSTQRAQQGLGLGISNCRPASQVVARVTEAEALGAEIAFVSEDVNCRDAFQLAALAAQTTSEIRLATGVVNPYTRNPTALAMAVATLDEVSGGRAVLGLGSSSHALIRTQMGIEYGDSVHVLQEAALIVRELLAGQSVNAEGERFLYREAQLEAGAVQEHVPIFFAAMGPRTLRMAGKIGDGVLLNVGASTQYISWAVEQVHAGAREANRSPSDVTIAAWLTVYMTEDRAAGLSRAKAWLARMLSVPRQGELLLEMGGFNADILPSIRAYVSAYPHSGDPARAGALISDEIAEQSTLIGSAQQVRQRLEEYRVAGVQVPVVPITALRVLG